MACRHGRAPAPDRPRPQRRPATRLIPLADRIRRAGRGSSARREEPLTGAGRCRHAVCVTDSAEDLQLWDAAAPAYAGRADSFYRRIHGFLWDRLGAVHDLEILDLGCGDGWLAEEMRQAGARVTGIDGSAALLARARSQYPSIIFEQRNLVLGLPRPQRLFDRIIAHMVLMDIPVLDRLLADVAAALRPGGVFVFTILHPAFFSHAIVDEGPGGQRYRKVTGYLEHQTRWIQTFGGHRLAQFRPGR
jgi:SAM-dependent methyltransferase